jgi:hypothetical protein
MKFDCLKIILAASVASSLLIGCEADDSMPTRPRPPWINPDENDAAKKREEEKKGRDVPGSGSEFPGQSRGGEGNGKVVTALSIEGPKKKDNAWGTMPHLHTLPRDQYAQGEVAVPDTDYTVDFSWGQVAAMKEAPSRGWQETKTAYQGAVVNHNPTYFMSLEEASHRVAAFTVPDESGFGSGSTVGRANIPRTWTSENPTRLLSFLDTMGIDRPESGSVLRFNMNGDGTRFLNDPRWHLNTSILNQAGFSGEYPSTSSVLGSIGGTVLETAWIGVEGVMLPYLMYQQHPFTAVQTGVGGWQARYRDPVYEGALPTVVGSSPTAYPGEVKWTYPWTRPLGAPPTTNPGSGELTPENSKDLRIKKNP